jgi:hypothetical protein
MGGLVRGARYARVNNGMRQESATGPLADWPAPLTRPGIDTNQHANFGAVYVRVVPAFDDSEMNRRLREIRLALAS